jgi:hypothetical protein
VKRSLTAYGYRAKLNLCWLKFHTYEVINVAKKEFVITYVEKVYYKSVVVEAETPEQALEVFNTDHLGSLDVIHVQKVKLEIEEA